MMIQRHRAAECLIFLFLVEQDKRSDGIGIGRSVTGGKTDAGSISGIGSGNHVSQPRIFTTEDLSVTITLEDI